jgi:hypothetical protein
LSITHHTRKRPSTGPRTTHGPQGANKKNYDKEKEEKMRKRMKEKKGKNMRKREKI